MRPEVLLVIGLFVAWHAGASAQDGGTCREPTARGPLFAIPGSGARGVTLDAPIKVQYTPGYFDDATIGASVDSLVSLKEGGTGVRVPGTSQRHGDTVFFIPNGRLGPNMTYDLVALGREQSLGVDEVFRFETGSRLDGEPPILGNIDSVTSSRIGAGVSCNAPEGGYRIGVSFPPATDDGPDGSIEYLLYETRGASIEEPVLRDRTYNYATDLVTMTFVLEPSLAALPTCVVVHAIDGTGKLDADGEPACLDPIQGNFFEPLCSVGRAKTGSLPRASMTIFLGFVLLALAHRLRSRRLGSKAGGFRDEF